MISRETIQEVLAANDIVDVIGSYFPLRKAGSNHQALCPFHREKTPSFNVSQQKQIFYCFGCHEKGNVISFVEKFERIPFPDAVRRLAARANIPVVEESSRPPSEADRARERLMELHRLAAEWFHRNLLKGEGDDAAAARAYLARRGLSDATIREWQLGHAPDSWDALSRWAASRGFEPALLLRGGLVKARGDESAGRGHYDTFRDRIMFPIHNERGEVVGFSGRTLDPAAKMGKYINSPETPIFHKGRLLFGLHRSKRAINQDNIAILCEGQMDLIACFEAGIENVVAPLGTAFGEEHARILRRYAEEVILFLDADEAGANAAERIFPRLLEADILVRVAAMPPGEDPDSLLRKEGADALRARLDAATDFIDHTIGRHARRFDLARPRGKLQFARHLASLIAPLRNPILREAAIAKTAGRIGVPTAELARLIPQPSRQAARAEQPAPRAPAPEGEPAPDVDPGVADPSHPVRILCLCALRDPGSLAWLRAQPWRDVTEALPDGAPLARILDAAESGEGAPSLADLLQRLPEAEGVWIGQMAFQEAPANAVDVTREWFERIRIELRLRFLQGERERLLGTPGTPPDTIGRVIQEILDLRKALLDSDKPPNQVGGIPE